MAVRVRTIWPALRRGPWPAVLGVLLAFALAAAGLAATTHPGAVERWERLSGLATSGAVRQIVAGQDEYGLLLYAVVERWGLFQSVDGGQSWQPVDRHLPRREQGQAALGPLALAPDDPELLLAAVDSSAAGAQPPVFKSRDGGLHWVPRRGLGMSGVKALATEPGHVAYAASDRHLYYSADDGDTWFEAGNRPTTAPVLALAVGARPGTLFLGTEGDGLWLTADRGASWRAALQRRTVYAIGAGSGARVYAATDDGLYESADGGASWRPSASPATEGPLLALAVAPGSPDRLFTASAGGPVHYSADGGTTWQTLRHTLLREPVTALAVDPRSPQHLYVGTRQGLWLCTLPAEVDDGRDAR